MAAAARVVLPYAPRRVFLPLHQRRERFAVVVAHRRAGKTVACINDLIARGLSGSETWRGGYIAPFYAQAKVVAWDYICRYTAPIPGMQYNVAELRADFPTGARIQLFGADNPDRLRGLYFDDLIADEYGDWKPSVWNYVIRPALADRQGRAVIIGTPKGRNAFYDVFRRAQSDPQWFTLLLRSDTSGILPASELAAMQAEMDANAWRQEMLCDFDAATPGAVLGPLVTAARDERRVTREVFDPRGAPITVSSDIGFRDTASWWFWQPRMDGFGLVGYLGASGMDADDWCEELQKYMGERAMRLSHIWLPHDARNKTFATKHSPMERFLSVFGADKVRVVPQGKVADRINAARWVLPRCWFDEEACGEGLDGLSAWSYDWVEESKTFSREPKHDWASHPGDAFSYGAQVLRELMPTPAPKPIEPIAWANGRGGIAVAPLETLWKTVKKPSGRI